MALSTPIPDFTSITDNTETLNNLRTKTAIDIKSNVAISNDQFRSLLNYLTKQTVAGLRVSTSQLSDNNNSQTSSFRPQVLSFLKPDNSAL